MEDFELVDADIGVSYIQMNINLHGNVLNDIKYSVGWLDYFLISQGLSGKTRTCKIKGAAITYGSNKVKGGNLELKPLDIKLQELEVKLMIF